MKKIWCSNESERYNVFRRIDENHTFKKHFVNKMYGAPMGFMIDDDGNVTQTKSRKIFKMNKGNNIPPMDYFCDAKIGDMVEVTDDGQTYSTYSQWHGLGAYKTKFKQNDVPTNGKTYKVVGIDTHNQNSTRIIVLIQDTETEQVYIMEQIGIRKVD